MLISIACWYVQYTTIHLASNTMGEEDKVGPLIIPEHVPSAQGLTQVTPSPSPSPSASPSPSPSPFSLSQVSYSCPVVLLSYISNLKCSVVYLFYFSI